MGNVILTKGTKYFSLDTFGTPTEKIEVVDSLEVAFVRWSPAVGVYELNDVLIFVAGVDNPEQAAMMEALKD